MFAKKIETADILSKKELNSLGNKRTHAIGMHVKMTKYKLGKIRLILLS
jgi:hypothetical protein